MGVGAGQSKSLPVGSFQLSRSMRLSRWCAPKEEGAKEETTQKVLEMSQCSA